MHGAVGSGLQPAIGCWIKTYLRPNCTVSGGNETSWQCRAACILSEACLEPLTCLTFLPNPLPATMRSGR